MKVKIQPTFNAEILDEDHCSLECPLLGFSEGCSRDAADCKLLIEEDNDELEIEYLGGQHTKMPYPVRCDKCKMSEAPKYIDDEDIDIPYLF